MRAPPVSLQVGVVRRSRLCLRLLLVPERISSTTSERNSGGYGGRVLRTWTQVSRLASTVACGLEQKRPDSDVRRGPECGIRWRGLDGSSTPLKQLAGPAVLGARSRLRDVPRTTTLAVCVFVRGTALALAVSLRDERNVHRAGSIGYERHHILNVM